jgi:two-component system sensor histidine kinase QseC
VNSIRSRLTIGLLVGFCVLWTGAATALYLYFRTGLLAEFDTTLLANAQALAALTHQRNGIFELDFPGEFIPGFEGGPAANYFQLLSANGKIIDQSPSLGVSHLFPSTDSTEILQYLDLTLPDGQRGRAVSLRFIPQGNEEAPDSQLDKHLGASVILTVALHRAGLDHRLGILATALLVVGGLLAVSTGLGVPLVVHRGLSPLQEVAEHASRIDVESLQLRFPSSNLPTELQPICGRLNELLARLQASFERERQFSADVAHELRTPIAELRSLAEVALRWPGEPAASTSALKETLEIAMQMGTIVNGLLSLARCEAGLQKLDTVPVRVAALMREIWESLADLAREKRLAIFWNMAEDGSMETDLALFRSILINLLSNAVDYSPAGGSIHICVKTETVPWQIDISNSVTDLTPADVPHLFERFWRRDPARSASSHSGLGLALTRVFAKSLGLEIAAYLTTTDVLTFTLRPGSSIREEATMKIPTST